MSDESPGKRRGLLGFYVGAGAVLALALAIAFGWTPLRVWYYERKIVGHLKSAGAGAPVTGPAAYPDLSGEIEKPLGELVALGPAAGPALERLLKLPDARYRLAVLIALGDCGEKWALPLVIEVAGRPQENPWVLLAALFAAGRISGEDFYGDTWAGTASTRARSAGEIAAARKRLLDWWERQGRAEHGRGAP